MEFRIEEIEEMKMVGKVLKMSLVQNKTKELWKSFMSEMKDIKSIKGNDRYSLQVYPDMYFDSFNPNNEFQKYALVEVSNFDEIPIGMHTYILPSGKYAVFNYKGSSLDTSIFQYIYGTWLPSSAYILDNRPHFEKLGDKYVNNDPNSEEEIWIPIKNK
ncbi:MAG: GyrI-like domain-containing protein [Candidatus Kapabacteria bacterium]|nr:GyrI-like domain-containing protein [Candidatus Kapabacteria bacterium]